MAGGPAIIAVSGAKNVGKTTFLTRLIPLLRAHGLRVAAIKHDGHEFDPDVPGTDSRRLREAGAFGVAVYSKSRYLLVREEETTIELLAAQLGDADLILLEGGKHSPYPKLELVRGAVSKEPVCDPGSLLALCTDAKIEIAGTPSLGLEDYEGAAGVILAYLKDQKTPCVRG